MAISTDNSIFGRFRGSIGPVVLTVYRDMQVARSKAKKSSKRKERPAKQQEQNIFFGETFDLLSQASDPINIGFQLPRKAVMSNFNAAMSYNLENAWINAEGVKKLDLTKLKFSKPIKHLQGVWNAIATSNDKGLIDVSWEMIPYPHKETSMKDRVQLLFYLKDELTLVQSGVVLREQLQYTFNTYPYVNLKEVYCYMFLYSEDKKLVSSTEFLGVINLETQKVENP